MFWIWKCAGDTKELYFSKQEIVPFLRDDNIRQEHIWKKVAVGVS